MNRWEYKVLVVELGGLIRRKVPEKELNEVFNKLGSDGWEFVESRSVEANEWTDKVIFIFRRQKQ